MLIVAAPGRLVFWKRNRQAAGALVPDAFATGIILGQGGDRDCSRCSRRPVLLYHTQIMH
jgi:hypothetical protein